MERHDVIWAGTNPGDSKRLLDDIMKDIVRTAIRRVIGPLAADLAALGKTFNLAAMSIAELKRALLAHRTGGRGAKIRRAGSARGRARAVKVALARKRKAK